MEERLWDFIDGTSASNEKMEISRLLETNPAWQKAYANILDIHSAILETTLEEPAMRFSKNVMEEIAKHKIAPSTKSYVNKKIIYSIAGFFLIIIGAMLIYLFTQIDFSQQGSITIPSDLPGITIDWTTYANSTTLNIFLIIDTILGLFLLDKYLRHKKDNLKAKRV